MFYMCNIINTQGGYQSMHMYNDVYQSKTEHVQCNWLKGITYGILQIETHLCSVSASKSNKVELNDV